MSAIIYWQNPCKLPMSFRCVKAFMHAFSGRFSRASLEGISFNFFVCFILNVSIGSAPKRKNIDIQRNTRVGLGCQFTSNLLSCHLMWLVMVRAVSILMTITSLAALASMAIGTTISRATQRLITWGCGWASHYLQYIGALGIISPFNN